MARLIFIVAVALSTSASAAPSLTWPVSEASISCRMVRYAVKLYSSEALVSMARAHGVSEATIQRLKRCAS
jgi:ABC-type dipeptide/oligopeptide/nickel transport system permease component